MNQAHIASAADENNYSSVDYAELEVSLNNANAAVTQS